MLYRFREAQAAELGLGSRKERRPYLASQCDNLKDADKWRGHVIRDISRNVSKIQDSGLSEYQVRDLNDQINKLLREKRHWEIRIKELGGPDYRRSAPRVLDADGKEVPGTRGYKYFGRARDLPGVRELFEPEAPQPEKKTRHELYTRVDADYYGYRDEDDGRLLEYEEEWERNNGEGHEEYAEGAPVEGDEPPAKRQKGKGKDPGPSESEDTSPDFIAHVPVPSQKEIEAWLVQRRQQQLADMFLAGTTHEEGADESKAS
ncbi:NineTeen Complex (NTC) component [Rhizophlyctis rosea]|uniref:NineTeen Complex (NTC) component n=1 Tax=Rhizophlyctis rosea TaxID=64517 RepID=A0AAD5S3G8_9FUNG|nr:NineTeen Complex (NTC) component [Rhizophlyctis rosea]